MKLTIEERNQLILTHMDLADRLANKRKRVMSRRIQLDELRSAAYLGLVDAAEKFDVNKGNNFRSYAAYRIIGEINDHLRREMVWDNQPTDFEQLLSYDECGAFSEFLEKVIQCLPQQGKQFFRWYYRDHCTLRQIASRLGISESYASLIMTRWKKTIQAHWLPEWYVLAGEAEARRY